MNDKPIRHSFSSTSVYETCGYQYQQVNLLKNFQVEDHPTAIFGGERHKDLEVALQSDTDIEGEHAYYNNFLERIRQWDGFKIPEMRLAIDRAWQPCGFFDHKVWYSGIVDVTVINGDQATVVDYKCGKHRLKPRQANDSALLLFLHFPELQDIHFEFWWTEAGAPPDVFDFNRTRDADTMIKTMTAIPEQIELSAETKDWPTNPSGLCRGYCPVVSCKHWKPRRE